jgi:hypothetical protein
MILVIVSFLAMAAALAASRIPAVAAFGERMRTWEAGVLRVGTVVVAVISFVVIWYTWDGIKPTPKVHDENSYLLQADIFARLRWTVPSPPIPDFFEQPHVQVEPSVASKYPPGHALVLTPGAMIGWHALMPLLLAGLTAALVFRLAARLTDVWTGLLTWLIWLTAPLILRFQASYFSEVTSAPLILASWWLLLNWREDHRGKWLWWMALAIGWCAITRQLTALAFALPIGIVALRDTVRLRLWRDLAIGVVVGTAVLAILPLWSAKTTGDWRLAPVVKYRQDYMPFDKLGFTADTSAPRRNLSPALQSTFDYFLQARKEQTLAAVPKTAWDRAVQVVIALFQTSRLPLALLALVGLFVCGGVVRFGVASGLVLFVSYLPYPHWAPWTIYYMEAVPVAAALAAIGTAFVVRRIALSEAGARGALAAVTLVIAAFGVPLVQKWKTDHRVRAAFDQAFAAQLKTLPSQHAIVFIQYSRRVAQHVSEVFNYADLESVPVWVVHDLGPARNAELRKMFPDRASFDFEEDQLVYGLRRKAP